MERQPGTAPDPKAPSRSPRIIEMQKQLDDRDETIRLLNEALCHALAELAHSSKAA